VQILRRPKFADDLTEAYAYLAENSPTAADRLLDAVEATASLIAAFPEIGRRRDELRPGVRSFRVRGFPHLVLYRLAEDAIVLLRCLHGARNLETEAFEE
jgi:toxin ParE1/3/4